MPNSYAQLRFFADEGNGVSPNGCPEFALANDMPVFIATRVTSPMSVLKAASSEHLRK